MLWRVRQTKRILMLCVLTLALAVIFAPDVVRILTGDDDPRIYAGSLILVMHAGGAYTARWDNRTLWTGNYVPIAAAAWIVLIGGTCVIGGRWLRTQIQTETQRKRTAKGQCVACGYDISHSSDQCPECGTVSQPVANPPA